MIGVVIDRKNIFLTVSLTVLVFEYSLHGPCFYWFDIYFPWCMFVYQDWSIILF